VKIVWASCPPPLPAADLTNLPSVPLSIWLYFLFIHFF
jgi:hypothetical protein